jgi:hypothetical protein
MSPCALCLTPQQKIAIKLVGLNSTLCSDLKGRKSIEALSIIYYHTYYASARNGMIISAWYNRGYASTAHRNEDIVRQHISAKEMGISSQLKIVVALDLQIS